MKIEIPNSLNAIPLKSYQKLVKREEPNEADTLSILLGVDIRIIRNLKAKSVTDLNSHLTEMFKEDPTFERFFTLNGIEFGFIPNLDNASWGETNDIEQSIGKFESMHEAMAVMYRPVTFKKGDKYLIEKYEPGKYNELMKEAPLGVVLGANLFFCDLMRDLSKSTLNYMKQEVAQAKDKGIFPENGESMDNYILSLEEVFSAWKPHLN